MSTEPEMDKLRERLKDAKNFNVWWGPEAHLLTTEERAKVLNDALDGVENGRTLKDCPPESGVPPDVNR